MAKKKKNRPERPAETANPPAQGRAQAVPAVSGGELSGGALPSDVASMVPLLFAVMMFLSPTLGVPHEEMLQDTLKSIIVSFAVLFGALAFFWRQRGRNAGLRWHDVMWLPLLLMAYALGSMVWSHTYLAGVEAVRWFIFALLLWLGMQCLSRASLTTLAWGIHLGAVFASLWTALQFWVAFGFFPQGPNPASTFVNRNFFAEFAVCTIPFTAYLLTRVRQSGAVALLSLSGGLVITAILMTGTRSALAATWLLLLFILPFLAWRLRGALGLATWPRSRAALALGLLLATVLCLGLIPSGNGKILEEERGSTALERGFKRTGSISPSDHSLGIRMIMWKATARIIEARPVTGVGAGAWENDVPLYQADGAQLETDYYVHNEFLQLLAEYGLAGWLFLLGLAAYLLRSTWITLRPPNADAQAEGPVRATALCSLLTLMIVCNVGFPWRMATTGALFALCLGVLAASDARIGIVGWLGARRLHWQASLSRAASGVTIACLVLAAYITQQAAAAEQKIVHAAKLALTISASGAYNHPRWNKAKSEMLVLIREGVAINPHYRKITPMVADELAKWGDWTNATWVWESVLGSRPYVVAILTNAGRGRAIARDFPKAVDYLERARKIQPNAASVRSLEVLILSRSGNQVQALERARAALGQGIFDFDLLNNAFSLAVNGRDYVLATQAMEMRAREFPSMRVASMLELGRLFAGPGADPSRAIHYFAQARLGVPEPERNAFMENIPPALRAAVLAGG